MMTPVILEFPVDRTVSARLRRDYADLQEQAYELGITLEEDGSFHGDAVGSLMIEDHLIRVTITDKPWYASIGRIRDDLQDLLM